MSEKITEDMIGCLCWFSEIDGNNKHIGILKKINAKKQIYLETCTTDKPYDYWWECCRPVKPDEVKFYGCCNDEYKKLKKALQSALEGFEWIEEQADTTDQYDYDEEVILKNVVKSCDDEVERIKKVLK